MLQDNPPSVLHEASNCVLKTERLILRRPTLADIHFIASLANDRRVAVNTRRLPHPYLQEHAVQLVGSLAEPGSPTMFLIELDRRPIGMVGIDWREPASPEFGYWLGIDHWGQGFATEAVRAVIDFAFEELAIEQLISGARVVNPMSRNVLEKCGFQWSGVELHRFEALGSSTPVDCFRLTRGVWSSLKNWGHSTRHKARTESPAVGPGHGPGQVWLRQDQIDSVAPIDSDAGRGRAQRRQAAVTQTGTLRS